jgi:pectinesterase
MKILFALLFFITAQSAAQHTHKEKEQILTVAKDGTGNFTTVQAAIEASPNNSTKLIIIKIKKGIYKEVINIGATKNNIHFIGQDKNSTILTFDNHAGIKLPNGDSLNTRTCASTFIYGNNFSAKNITFENSAGFTAGQAVAVRIEGDRASFFNCKFLGNQDVLFLSGNDVKHYFEKCYIEGTTDFIFGSATAVFKNCTIHSKKNSHVTAASTNANIPFGFVFFNCTLTADTSINKVSLGRPWSPTASVTYIKCTLGKLIIAEGWNNWKNPKNEATVRYAEYKSKGVGANDVARVKWAKQLTKEEVKIYTIKNILGDWKP